MFKVLEIKHRSKMKVKMKQVMFNIRKSKIANKSQGITIYAINIINQDKLITDKILKDTKILSL